MTREEAINEIKIVFTPTYADRIVSALSKPLTTQECANYNKENELLKRANNLLHLAFENSFKQNMNFIKAFKEIKALEGGISSYYNDRPWVFKDEVIAIIEKYIGGTEYGTDSN